MATLADIDINKPNVAVDSVPVCDGYTKEIREATVASFSEEHHLLGPHKVKYGDTAARPAAGFLNRLYYNFETKEIERDTGAGWIGLGFFTTKIKVVSYMGDGNPTKGVVGIGGPPIAIFVAPISGNNPSFLRFTTFAAADSHRLNDANTVIDGIISLDPDGFTVGIGANVNGVTYSVLCLLAL